MEGNNQMKNLKQGEEKSSNMSLRKTAKMLKVSTT